nr:hypothetical protein [Deinococcus sp. KNUC1210]
MTSGSTSGPSRAMSAPMEMSVMTACTSAISCVRTPSGRTPTSR